MHDLSHYLYEVADAVIEALIHTKRLNQRPYDKAQRWPATGIEFAEKGPIESAMTLTVSIMTLASGPRAKHLSTGGTECAMTQYNVQF